MHTLKKSETREILFSVTTSNGLVVETFRSGGKGGQHQNVTDSGARVRHPESGAVGESREERSQLQNKRTALKRMAKTPQFTYWVSQKVKALDSGKTAEQIVDDMIQQEDDFKIEIKDEHGRWVLAFPDDLV